MPLRIALGTPPVSVTVRQSANARRLTLRLNRFNGEATLTVPARTGQSLISEFLDRQESWLRAQIENAPQRVRPAFGDEVPVEGEMLTLVDAARGPVRRQPGGLAVPGGPDAIGPKLLAYLKTLARERLSEATGYHAGVLGKSVSRLTLRDTRSRWGSCTSAGNLMFSWRLVMAPPEVLDYVAAHEVGHLVHMDHSPAFWDVVSDLIGDFREPRRWLRREGVSLHRFDFEAAA
jgi:predicted metal-dependent hydrolase